jgi:hypothetical protein
LKDLGAYFREEELLGRLNDLIQRDRMDAFWYFLLMSGTVFIHNWSIASNSEEYLGMKWVLLSTKQFPTFKWIHIVDQQIGYYYRYA